MDAIEREEVTENCIGCGRIAGKICEVYAFPAAKWEGKRCPMCTVIKEKAKSPVKLVDPLKASKRKAKGK